MRHFRSELVLFISLMVTWVHSQDCGKVLTGNSGTFTSPNYPDEYDHKLNCVWTIQAPARHFVKLTLDHMDLKNPFWSCGMDYITIDMGDEGDHKYCNDAPPTDKTIKSVTSTMKITLHTDDFFRNGVGFSASYVIVDRNGKPVESEEDTEEETTTTEKTTTTTTTTLKSTTTTLKPTTTTTTTLKSTTTTLKPTTTTTTTLKSTTTTLKPTTTTSTTLKTTTTKKTTPTPQKTSVLVSKMTTAASEGDNLGVGQAGNQNGDGISSDAGKLSGFVVGLIIAVIVIVVAALCGVAFIRYRRNKDKRITLSVVATPDDKELIGGEKVYKKNGYKIVRDQEAETFPL